MKTLAIALIAFALPLAAAAQDVPLPVTPESIKLVSQPARDGSDAPLIVDTEKEGQAWKAPSLQPNPVTGTTALPGWNQPPDLDALSETRQYASVPGVDRERLIQWEGRQWRILHNGPLTKWGGWLLAAILAAIAVFYLVRGSLGESESTGRRIERFTVLERASHWTMAGTFVGMALTGMTILWGKHLILPWLGYEGFSWLLVFAKTLHNFLGPLFILALVGMVLLFVKDNVFRFYDLRWLAKAGGMLGGEEPPSGRFNGGEKVWFWGGMVVLGALVSATGLVLDFPNFDQGRNAMQLADLLHAIGATLFIGGSFGHIYLGTLGVKGAFGAMRTGYVDAAWAREKHSVWYDDIAAGRRPERIVAAPQRMSGDGGGRAR